MPSIRRPDSKSSTHAAHKPGKSPKSKSKSKKPSKGAQLTRAAAARETSSWSAKPLMVDRAAKLEKMDAKLPSLDAVFEAMPCVGGGPAKARVLSSNLDAWNARWDMLQAATESIDTQYFILEKDVYGFAFLGVLLEKQLGGVKVRAMTDAMADTFGKHGFKMPLRGKDYLQELVNHGAEVSIYHPIHDRLGTMVKQGGFATLASNHDKIIVVDGREGITGGRNIGIESFAHPKDLKGAWRDMDVSLKGEGPAKGLTISFEREFDNKDISVPVSRDRLGNWDKKDIQLIGTAKMMDVWLKAPPFTDAEKVRLRSDPALRTALANDLVEAGLAALPSFIDRRPSDQDREFLLAQAEQLVGQVETRGSNRLFKTGGTMPTRDTQAKVIDQTSAANGRINGMASTMTDMIRAAKTRVVIENPYVVLTEDMLKELEAASKRGVKIDLITNSPLSTDSAQTQAFFLEDWPMILARCPTCRIYVATGENKFHTKAAVVDGTDAFISTYNLDLLSGYVNSELGAMVKSEELAGDLLRSLENDLLDPSNGFLEYTIERDAVTGRAKLVNGQPVITFGPEDHLPAAVLEDYKGRRKLWGQTLRNNVPYLEPLRHPPLEP
ncbi:MAG: phosphatidylserine/phosphatidylglycerophosphate/cardiolipin synthase family protein [Myxococcaceae bacterium]|nr:phosphatidylserine/phosphatidylglycerophosphate/cardiolipin synthase family protein [Myxococcaceae bacterium]